MGRFESGHIGRRAFLKNGVLVLGAAALDVGAFRTLAAEDDAGPEGVRIGLITDLHYADKAPAGTRYYRETTEKLAEAVERFREEDLGFVVELGDLIDAADTVATERGYLRRINRQLAAVGPRRHYVLGNHCVFTLTKEEFLDEVEQTRSFGSFDHANLHFIMLDSCFRSDGKPYGRKNFEWTDANLPAAELEWLRADLKATTKPVIVFAHQRLDVGNHYGVKNAPEVRRALEESGKVLAVFQGHSHRNDYKEIAGIHYCTLVAMIEGPGRENSGYSILNVRPDGTLRLRGFRKQAGHQWPASRT